jgi:predicted hydrocarbon binding protein
MNYSIPTTSYSNRMGQILLLGMEEIIGQGGVQAVLQQACLTDMLTPFWQELNVSFNIASQLQESLEIVYGEVAGRGLAVRSGRACFRHILREFGPELGLSSLDFRLLPLQSRVMASTQALSSLFNGSSDQQVELEQDDGSIRWTMESCPFCWERHTDSPACHLTVGLLQEALYWVSGGKIFLVEETHCIARGDQHCAIRIRKNPLK